MHEYDSNDLKSTLMYIKVRFGTEPFMRNGRVVALLFDLAPELNKERNMIERFSNLGILEEFATTDAANNGLQKRVIAKSFTVLTEEEYILPNIVNEYINILAEVFGWSERANNSEKEKISTEKSSGNVVDNKSSADNLIDRGIVYLENGEWEKANEFFEKALAMDAKEPMAYFCKMMVECKIKHPSEISNFSAQVCNNPNFKIAYKLGTTEFKKEIDRYLTVKNDSKQSNGKPNFAAPQQNNTVNYSQPTQVQYNANRNTNIQNSSSVTQISNKSPKLSLFLGIATWIILIIALMSEDGSFLFFITLILSISGLVSGIKAVKNKGARGKSVWGGIILNGLYLVMLIVALL